MTYPILFDIAILAIVILFVALGVHRGGILTLFSLLAVIVALIGGSFLSDLFSPMVSDAIQPVLETSIQATIDTQIQSSDETGIDKALDALRDKGGLSQWAADWLEETRDTLDDAVQQNLAQVVSQAAAAVAGQLARGILFTLGFLAVLIAWNVLAHALDLVAKLPVLDSLNGALGGVLGLVKGLLIVYVAAWVLCDLTASIPKEVVEQTYLLKALREFSPLTLFTSKP